VNTADTPMDLVNARWFNSHIHDGSSPGDIAITGGGSARSVTVTRQATNTGLVPNAALAAPRRTFTVVHTAGRNERTTHRAVRTTTAHIAAAAHQPTTRHRDKMASKKRT
jgi:hypothetical protein